MGALNEKRLLCDKTVLSVVVVVVDFVVVVVVVIIVVWDTDKCCE